MTREDKRNVIHYYFKSSPTQRRYLVKCTRFNTRQRLADQVGLTLMKSRFSNLEICGQVYHDEPPTGIETQNIETQTITEASTTESLFIQENRLNALLSITTPKVMIETEKVNKLLKRIPTDNITELNKLIYAGEKLVSDKTGIPSKNSNKIWNLDWKWGYKDK